MNDPLQQNYEELVIAIVKQAVNDSTKKSHSPEKHSADRFLKSDWCKFLVFYFDVDVDYFRRLVVAERSKKRAKYRY